MRLLRVHAPIGHQPEKMQAPLAGACMFHGIEQHRMREEFAVADHQINARDVHVEDTAGTNIEMTDLAVAHLTLGQPNEWTTGMNERVRVLAQQAVIRGFARKS